MNTRILLLILGVASFAGAALVACGGGGGDSESDDVASPTAAEEDETPADQAGGVPQATATQPAASATSDGPVAPEGAAADIETGRVSGGSDDGTQFVTPLDDWDGFGDDFGTKRTDALSHAGIDFILESDPGADVYAACDGWVAGVTEAATHGTYVVVKCGESRWTTVYAHMGELLVKQDDTVVAGETVIGHVQADNPWGTPMLHFEMRFDFTPVNPEFYLPFHIRPSVTYTPTPSPTNTPIPVAPTNTATNTPQATATNTPASGGGGGGGGNTTQPTPTRTSTPTITPTPTNTPTPTPWFVPTSTPVPPTATPTYIPTATPTFTPVPKPPTPTPTPPLVIY